MENNDIIELIQELKKVQGAQSFDGDVSTQVRLPIGDGKFLRVGVTDPDVGSGKLWFDYYEGLKIV